MKLLLSFLSLSLLPVLAQVSPSADAISPIAVSDAAPNPALQTVAGEEKTLDDLRAGQPTIVVFYRGGWCPYCTRQLSELQDALPSLKEAGWQLLAVSPDQPSKLSETMDAKELDYTLLSDSSMEAAKAFGLAFQVDQKTVKMLTGYGIDLIAASGETHQQLPVPAVIAIDATGKVAYVHHDPNYKERLSSEELLKTLTELP